MQKFQKFVGHRLLGDIIVKSPQLAAQGALPGADVARLFQIVLLFLYHGINIPTPPLSRGRHLCHSNADDYTRFSGRHLLGSALRLANVPPGRWFRLALELFMLVVVPELAALPSSKDFRMNVTHALAPHLPYLRRYARALTGSQESGDAYVRAALTALLAGEHVLEPDLSPRVALYRLFHQIWSSPAAHYEAAAAQIDDSNNPEGRLLALSASRRAALLLTAVE